ncbi:MAG: bacteriocin [Parasphingorhabdus sp.]
MTDKKTEILNKNELDQVQGGLIGWGLGELQEVKKSPSGKGDIKKPGAKGMERVFDDE